MKTLFFVPLALALSMLVFAMYVTGIEMFFDVPSMIITYVVSLLILLTHFSPGEIFRAFYLTFHSTAGNSNEIRSAIRFFRSSQKIVLASGTVGTVTGVIVILSSLEKSGNLGTAFAVSIITVFYAALYALFISLPCVSALEKKLIESE